MKKIKKIKKALTQRYKLIQKDWGDRMVLYSIICIFASLIVTPWAMCGAGISMLLTVLWAGLVEKEYVGDNAELTRRVRPLLSCDKYIEAMHELDDMLKFGVITHAQYSTFCPSYKQLESNHNKCLKWMKSAEDMLEELKREQLIIELAILED